jgi:hypothetical protein
MGKTWVLDTETKGTGANMVPLEKAQEKAEAQPRPAPRRAKRAPARPPSDAGRAAARPRSSAKPVQKSATPLPPGHVRKKTTGELGKVRSVDAKAGTAVVHWLRSGHVSTVPLSAVSRR